MTFDPHDKLSGGGAWYILAREMDTILRKGGHNFTMKQRCSSRERARCEMYLRNSQGGRESHAAKATRQRKKASFTRNLTTPELEEPSAPAP